MAVLSGTSCLEHAKRSHCQFSCRAHNDMEVFTSIPHEITWSHCSTSYLIIQTNTRLLRTVFYIPFEKLRTHHMIWEQKTHLLYLMVANLLTTVPGWLILCSMKLHWPTKMGIKANNNLLQYKHTIITFASFSVHFQSHNENFKAIKKFLMNWLLSSQQSCKYNLRILTN